MFRLQLADQLFPDDWVQQRFQPLALLRCFKHNGPKLCAVKGTGGIQDVCTKMFGNSFECRCARLNHFAGNIVRVDPVDAKIPEHADNSRFAGADSAGKAYDRHQLHTQKAKPETLDLGSKPEAQ